MPPGNLDSSSTSPLSSPAVVVVSVLSMLTPTTNGVRRAEKRLLDVSIHLTKIHIEYILHAVTSAVAALAMAKNLPQIRCTSASVVPGDVIAEIVAVLRYGI